MDLIAIGYFTKTHGIKGHLILKAEKDFETEGLAAVFCDSATGKAPYFIAELKESAQGIILKLEEVNAIEVAKTLVNKQVYIDSKFYIPDDEGDDFVGYELIDKNHGSLGKITSVSHNGFQDLVNLNYKGREVILPMVEEFIEEIIDTEKKVIYNAPEGLVEIYLSDDTEESDQ